MNRRKFIRSLVAARKPNAAKVTQAAASSSLEPWQPSQDDRWDVFAVNHLYSRLGFGASKRTVDRALTKTPEELIDELFDDALVTTDLPAPPIDWETWLIVSPYIGSDTEIVKSQDFAYYNAKADIRNHWTALMTDPALAAREKLTMFWHNHFVIDDEKTYYPQIVYRYFELIRNHAWGNFRSFVQAMAIDRAMLFYLDGVHSEKGKINENFAREMMELFTMGTTGPDGNANYTTDDVKMVAAACSGWRVRFEAPGPDVLPLYFAPYRFDFQTKSTPFGADPKVYGLKSSGDGLIEADIIDTLFERRAWQVAHFITEKLYRHFVYMGDLTPESYAVIDELAQMLIDTDWELKPMLMRLFKSEHFFDLAHRGGAIKSPYDYMIGIMNKLDVPLTLEQSGSLSWYGKDTGMWIVAPPNVRGWRGYRSWLTTATLPKRINWIARDLLIGQGVAPKLIDPRTDGPYDGVVYSDDEVLRWAKQFASYKDDLEPFAAEIASFFLASPPEEAVLQFVFTNSGIAYSYEWMTLPDEERIKPIRHMVFAIMQLAEFQLM